MAHSKTKYNWTGGDSQSAEDRALDTFAELMIDRIQTIDQDWKKPWLEKGGFVMPRNLSGRAYNGMNTFFLLLHSMKEKYNMPVFVTYNQVAYDLNNKSKLESRSDEPIFSKERKLFPYSSHYLLLGIRRTISQSH